MYVPAATPVQPGQSVRLQVAGVAMPEISHLAQKPVEATVVRVDRQSLIANGQLGIGLRFTHISA